MVAGIAAGISAVFRTPLGAALLAIEVLYRDDFESEALIPAVLASVVAYSVVVSACSARARCSARCRATRSIPSSCRCTCCSRSRSPPFASLFVAMLRFARKRFAQAAACRTGCGPALGGLVLGVFVVALMFTVDPWIGSAEPRHGHARRRLRRGAGRRSPARRGCRPAGRRCELLLAARRREDRRGVADDRHAAARPATSRRRRDRRPRSAARSARAAQLLLDDPSIEPGAFALVGMGAFYGGIANTPLAALVMVCELAGSYDLLVPLMLAEGVAMIALRKVNLYKSQPRTTKESPVHARILSLRCGDVIDRSKKPQTLESKQSIQVIAGVDRRRAGSGRVPGARRSRRRWSGSWPPSRCASFVAEGAAIDVAIVADVMVPPLVFALRDDVRTAALSLVRRDLRSAPVLDETGAIAGMIDEHDIMRALSGNPGESMA